MCGHVVCCLQGNIVSCSSERDVSWEMPNESVPVLCSLLHLCECVCLCVCVRVCEYIGHVETSVECQHPKIPVHEFYQAVQMFFFFVCVILNHADFAAAV